MNNNFSSNNSVNTTSKFNHYNKFSNTQRFNNKSNDFSKRSTSFKKTLDVNYLKEVLVSRNTSKTREKGRVRSKDIKMIVANPQTNEIGFGSGKAKFAFPATIKAEKKARRNFVTLQTLKLKNNSVTIAQKATFTRYGIKFIVQPSYNTRMQTAPLISKILYKAGITALKVKQIGNGVIANQARGFIEGLSKIESLHQVAQRLNRPHAEILEKHMIYRNITNKQGVK